MFENKKKFAIVNTIGKNINHMLIIPSILSNFYLYCFGTFEIVALTLQEFVCNENLIYVINIAKMEFFPTMQQGLI